MKRKLNTIQKIEKLNNVFAIDEKGVGNANHRYTINRADNDNDDIHAIALINFQNGARKDPNSTEGVLD